MRDLELIEGALTESIIGCFYEVYRELDFGFLERTYVRAMRIELRARGHAVETECKARVLYKGECVTEQRLDMIVDGKVIIEVKTTLDLHPIARRQLRSYLKSTNLEVGLLLHFGAEPKFYRMVATNQNPKNVVSAPFRARPLESALPLGSALQAEDE